VEEIFWGVLKGDMTRRGNMTRRGVCIVESSGNAFCRWLFATHSLNLHHIRRWLLTNTFIIVLRPWLGRAGGCHSSGALLAYVVFCWVRLPCACLPMLSSNFPDSVDVCPLTRVISLCHVWCLTGSRSHPPDTRMKRFPTELNKSPLLPFNPTKKFV
jgi:hypothetical protein